MADDYQSRNEAFSDGIEGTPQSTATSMQQNISPVFRPDSILEMANIPSGVGEDPREYGMTNTKKFGLPAQAAPAAALAPAGEETA
jgi:hypothetical protein